MFFWFKAFRIETICEVTNLIGTRLRAVQLLPFLSVIVIVKLCLSANNGWQPEDRDPAEAIMANWGRSKQTTLQTRGVYQFNRTMVLCIYLCEQWRLNFTHSKTQKRWYMFPAMSYCEQLHIYMLICKSPIEYCPFYEFYVPKLRFGFGKDRSLTRKKHPFSWALPKLHLPTPARNLGNFCSFRQKVSTPIWAGGRGGGAKGCFSLLMESQLWVSESSDRWWQLFIAVHYSVKYHIIGWVLRLALKWTILVVKRIHEGTITGAHKSVISQ